MIPFAAQHRGQSMRDVVADYRERAKKAVIDHAFHMIVSDPSETVLAEELPALIRDGYSSLKLFMTYPLLRLDDGQMLDLLSARAARAARWSRCTPRTTPCSPGSRAACWSAATRAPRYHAISHPRVAEAEAVEPADRHGGPGRPADRGVPCHDRSGDGARSATPRRGARRCSPRPARSICSWTRATSTSRGSKARNGCSARRRATRADRAAIWRGVRNGTFQIVSSDHAPYRFDETGKLAKGPNPDFKQIANGIPGIELRLPLLFSEGVAKRRIGLERFVELCCTNPAKIYGLHPKKGTIAIGSDADLAIWHPEKKVEVTNATTHDATGYCPYAGMTLTGWPETVIARGEVIVQDGELLAERGRGRFLPRAAGEAAQPAELLVPEIDPARNFGAELLD